MKAQVDILLSTFDGENYLAEQIESLLSQSYTDWVLWIRDDGSTDSTNELIDKFISLYPEKIKRLIDGNGSVGTAESYSLLLQHATADYVALCDQDDVWLADKLALQFSELQKSEQVNGVDCPILVATDLEVVDQKLSPVSDSLWKYQKLSPEKGETLKGLLVQNHNTGCTFLMNRSLVKAASPIGDGAIMHDWWLTLIAAANGKVINMPQSLVLYRQHGENVLGAKKWSIWTIFSCGYGIEACRSRLIMTRNQAVSLLKSGQLSTSENQQTVKAYVDMFSQGWLRRRYTMLREGYYKYGFLRNLAMFVFV